MPKIKHARFLRAIETEDSLTAEVEFALEDDLGLGTTPPDGADREALANSRTAFTDSIGNLPAGESGTLTAVLKKDGDADYRLERICRDAVADDSAGEDLAGQMFAGAGSPEERERFVQEVLAFEGVQEDMDGRREEQ